MTRLSRQEVALLTPEQLQRYLDDGVVRDLAELEQMPESMRSWAQRVVEGARARALAGSGRRAGAPLSLMTSLVTDW